MNYAPSPKGCSASWPSIRSANEWAPGLWGDFPAEHHGVVLVGQVVAVRHVRSDEVAEPAEDDHRFTRIEPDHVFFPVSVWAGLRRPGRVLAVAHHHAVLFHVQVHRVHPTTTTVADLPHVVAVHLLLRQRRLTGR